MSKKITQMSTVNFTNLFEITYIFLKVTFESVHTRGQCCRSEGGCADWASTCSVTQLHVINSYVPGVITSMSS